jgi:hypothetical protein
MRSLGEVGRTFVVAVVALLAAKTVTCEEIRVLLIQPESAKVVPRDSLGTFKQAILGAAPDVTFVATIKEATDLIELTRYEWSPDEERGVHQTWEFYFRPLDPPDDLPVGRARPGSFIVMAGGRTLKESTQSAARMLRDELNKLLLSEFRGPVVPK